MSKDRQPRIQALIKEALVILKQGSDKENALAVVISTAMLSMWKGKMIFDISDDLEHYKEVLVKDEFGNNANKEESEEKIKKVLDGLFGKLKKKAEKKDFSPEDMMNEIKEMAKEITKQTGLDVDVKHVNAMDEKNTGSVELHNKLSELAIEMVESKDRVDNETAQIITKILLARKFGIIGMLAADVSSSDEVYELFAKVLMDKNKSKEEKQSQAEKVLTDPKIDQSVKDLINESLKNNPNN